MSAADPNFGAIRPRSKAAYFGPPKQARQPTVRNIGPGYYDVDKGMNYTKPSSKTAKISPVKERPTPKQQENTELQYASKKFGDGVKTFTIGTKRKERVENSPGPGEYDHERSVSATKTRVPSVDFTKTGERFSPMKASDSPDYDIERFYNYPKEIPNYSLGQKRELKQDQKPGPGEYEVNLSQTKARTPGGKISPIKGAKV